MACEAAFRLRWTARCGYDSYLTPPLNAYGSLYRAGKVGGIHGVRNINEPKLQEISWPVRA